MGHLVDLGSSARHVALQQAAALLDRRQLALREEELARNVLLGLARLSGKHLLLPLPLLAK